MIRNTAIFAASVLFLVGCATNKNFQTTQSFEPAKFQISDVYVNMQDGVENSKRIRELMKKAGTNTAEQYNDGIESTRAEYPLEIEVSEINYRKPNASIVSGDRTYIKYTATLRDEASGIAYRTLPVTYYHVVAGSLTSDDAKLNAEKNMIRLSIKNAFARLYGMENVPQNIETHFATNDIFADPNKTVAKPIIRKPVTPVVSAPVATSPEPVIVAPDEPVIESTSTDGGPVVIKCVVC